MLSDWNVWKVTGPRCWYEALERYLWRITMVSDSYAYTRLYSQSETTNNDGWVDPGYAGSWHRKKPR